MPLDQEIACFSYDDEHEHHPDGRSLRYYFPPRIGADLSRGFKDFKQLDDARDDHLDSLLKSLMLREKEIGQKIDVDFVTWVGYSSSALSSSASTDQGSDTI